MIKITQLTLIHLNEFLGKFVMSFNEGLHKLFGLLLTERGGQPADIR
ncbi:Uncharacterised protein [Vibrio cholerae]|nr:Uncharacterised protein [Vibrio cholerae]